MKFTYAPHLYKGCSPMGFSLFRVQAVNTIIQKKQKKTNKKKPLQNHACKYEEIIVEGFMSSSKVVLYKAYCG